MTTVKTIMDLMIDSNYTFQFFIAGRTFEFLENDIPNELYYMTVESIDDPIYQSNCPLCLNINEDEFDDFSAFEKEFKDYLI